MVAGADEYLVDLLPRFQPILGNVLSKFKTLRLEALHTSPSAFLPPYAREAAFSDARWEQQITNPLNHYLICHIRTHPTKNHCHGGNEHEDSQAITRNWLLEDEWVGMFILAGPLPKDQYSVSRFPSAATALGSDEEETRWHISGLYLQPGHRCGDSAIAMHEAILSYLRVWTDDQLATVFDSVLGSERPKRARLAGSLRSESPALEEMYRALDGRVVGEADRALGLLIAGIEDPTFDGIVGDDDERMQVMERVIEC